MKRNLLKSIIILFTLTFVTLQSCKKKELTSLTPVSIDLNGINIKAKYAQDKNNINTLVFSSVDDYENAITFLAQKDKNFINSWNEKTGFNSMKKAFSDNPESIPVKDDDVITSLLNKKGEIQIEDKLLRLNFETNRVEEIVYTANNKLEVIDSYSFDDDVLSVLFKNKEPESDKSKYCSGNTKTTYMNTICGRVDCKVKYLRLGIYYTLYAKISKQNSSAVKIGLTTIYYNQTKYQNKSGCWSFSSSKSGYGNSYKITAYSGVKRLKAYIIPINFWYDYINGNSYGNVGLNMSCGTPDC